MKRRYFWVLLAVLVLLFSGFLIIIPGSHALPVQAHATIGLDTPTPTPDASTILQRAQQEETNIQTILNIINILVVVYPILLAIAAAILGVIGVRGYQSFEKQAREQVGAIKKLKEEAEAEKITLGHTLEDVIKKLKEETEAGKAALERTQTAIVYLALGDRLSNQKDMRQAILAYKKAGSLLPKDPQINYVLGRIYSSAGYYEEAINAFQAAIVAQSDYAEAEKELGVAYRMRGDYHQGPNAQGLRRNDYDKAKEHLQRAIELQPGYVDALSSLGGIYRREKDYESSLEYYERAYRADTSSSYAIGNVASLALYLGKKDEARYYYLLTEAAATVRTKELYSEIYWDYYDLALAQLVLGKADEAKKNYLKAIGDTPGVAQFDSVLNVLKFLRDAKEPINGLDDVIQMIEKEKATRIALG